MDACTKRVLLLHKKALILSLVILASRIERKTIFEKFHSSLKDVHAYVLFSSTCSLNVQCAIERLTHNRHSGGISSHTDH